MGTGNQDSSPFRSFCRKPKPKASLPISTRTSHNCQTLEAAYCHTDPRFPCFVKEANCSRSVRSRCPLLPLSPSQVAG